MVTEHVRRTVAAVFDCAVADIECDDILDDIGLDSMMAMDFRVRINTMFAIDLPVLEILRGVSVNSLAVRVLDELAAPDEVPEVTDRAAEDTDDGVAQLIDELSESELRALLAELEGPAAERETGG